jgi:hypothetical protein
MSDNSAPLKHLPQSLREQLASHDRRFGTNLDPSSNLPARKCSKKTCSTRVAATSRWQLCDKCRQHTRDQKKKKRNPLAQASASSTAPPTPPTAQTGSSFASNGHSSTCAESDHQHNKENVDPEDDAMEVDEDQASSEPTGMSTGCHSQKETQVRRAPDIDHSPS